MSWRAQRAAIERLNYYSDSRVQSSLRTPAYEIVSAGPNVSIIRPHPCLTEGDDDDGDPLDDEYEARTSFCMCSMCRGSGRVVDPKIDASGISQDEFDEDPQFKRDYYGGMYDIQCPECKGVRVVPDGETMLNDLPPGVKARIVEFQQDMDDDLSERLSELRMGCG